MDIQKMIDSYANWIKERITFEKVNEYYEITVPLYHFIGDAIQIYAKFENNNITTIQYQIKK